MINIPNIDVKLQTNKQNAVKHILNTQKISCQTSKYTKIKLWNFKILKIIVEKLLNTQQYSFETVTYSKYSYETAKFIKW